MPRWEFAQFRWDGSARGNTREVRFSHRPDLDRIDGEDFNATLRSLGDEGFEMVASDVTPGVSGMFISQLWFKRQIDE